MKEHREESEIVLQMHGEGIQTPSEQSARMN
jgi:hypothetical protein